MVFVPMSTTCARNIWAICRISLRLAPESTVTLIIASSRSTRSFPVRSDTLITSMSLFSCFMTCSICASSPIQTMVIRLIPGSSQVPTARLSILKPRREKSPVTRESTPARFSTRIERECGFMNYYPQSSRYLPHREVLSGRRSLPVQS